MQVLSQRILYCSTYLSTSARQWARMKLHTFETWVDLRTYLPFNMLHNLLGCRGEQSVHDAMHSFGGAFPSPLLRTDLAGSPARSGEAIDT